MGELRSPIRHIQVASQWLSEQFKYWWLEMSRSSQQEQPGWEEQRSRSWIEWNICCSSAHRWACEPGVRVTVIRKTGLCFFFQGEMGTYELGDKGMSGRQNREHLGMRRLEDRRRGGGSCKGLGINVKAIP